MCVEVIMCYISVVFWDTVYIHMQEYYKITELWIGTTGNILRVTRHIERMSKFDRNVIIMFKWPVRAVVGLIDRDGSSDKHRSSFHNLDAGWVGAW